MVDLHQVEPGLPDGHPWKEFSRWQITWRSFCGISIVGMVGTVVFGVVTSGGGSLSILETFMPVVFALIVPLIGAGLAATFGTWLRRYFPFTQALLFAGISVATVVVLAAIISVWKSIARGPCPPDTLCSAPLDGAFWVIIIFGLPVFLSSAIGFGLSIWLSTRRNAHVFWLLWCGIAAILVAAVVIVRS